MRYLTKKARDKGGRDENYFIAVLLFGCHFTLLFCAPAQKVYPPDYLECEFLRPWIHSLAATAELTLLGRGFAFVRD